MTKKTFITLNLVAFMTFFCISYSLLTTDTGIHYKKKDPQNHFFIREVLAPESQLKNISLAQIVHMEALDFILENNEKFLQEDRKVFEKWLGTKQGIDKKYSEIMNSIHDSLLRIPQMEVRQNTLYGIWSNMLSLNDSMDSSQSRELILSSVENVIQAALKDYAPVHISFTGPAHTPESLLKELETLPKNLQELTSVEDVKKDPYFNFLIRLNDWEQLRKWKSQGIITEEVSKIFSNRRKQIIDLLINEANKEVAGTDIKNEGKSVLHEILAPGSNDGVNSDYDPTVKSLSSEILGNRSEVVVKKFYEKFNTLMRETAEQGSYIFPDTCFDTNVYTDPILFNLEEFGSASNEIMTLETAMSFFAFLQNVGSTDALAWKKLKDTLTNSLKGKNEELLRNMNLMIGIGERRFNSFMDEISLRRPSNYNSLNKYQQKEIDKIIKNNLFLVELEKLSALKETIKNNDKSSRDPEVMKDLLMQSMIVKSFEDDAYITPGAFIETVINGQEAKYDPTNPKFINLRGKGMHYRQFCSMIENAAKMLKIKEKYAEDSHKSLSNSAKYISRLLQTQYSMNALDDETGDFMHDMHTDDKAIEELVLQVKKHKGQNAIIEGLILEKMQSKGSDSKNIADELLTACENQFYEGLVGNIAQINFEIRNNKMKKWHAEIEAYQNKDADFKGPDLFNIFGKNVSEYEMTDWVGILMVIYNKLGNHYEQVEKDFVSNEGITMKNTFLAKSLQNKIANIPEMNNTQLSAALKEVIDYLKQSRNAEQQALGRLNLQFVNKFLAAA